MKASFAVVTSRISLSRALYSTVLAWVASTAFLLIVGTISNDSNRWVSIRDIAEVGYLVGVVVLPACLLLVFPILSFLPRPSTYWKTASSAVASATVLFTACVIVSVALGRLYVPELNDRAHVVFGLTAIVAGTTFAYFYIGLPQPLQSDHC